MCCRAECPGSTNWNWTESELGWEDSLTEWAKGHGNLHPRMSGLKETWKFIEFLVLHQRLKISIASYPCKMAIQPLEYIIDRKLPISHCTDIAEKMAGVSLDGGGLPRRWCLESLFLISIWLKFSQFYVTVGKREHCFIFSIFVFVYFGQVTTVHGTTDWFQIGKGVCQGCILSPCLFTLDAEYIIWIAGLNEAQTGVKIAGENINNLRYADDTTLRAESKEELKNLLMKLKEESEKASLKFNIQKAKIMASGPITSW